MKTQPAASAPVPAPRRRLHAAGIAAAALLIAAPAIAQQQAPLTGSMLDAGASAQPATRPAPAMFAATATTAASQPGHAPASPPSSTAPGNLAAAASDDDAPPPSRIGDTTRQLLRMQAEGSHAGKSLPLLGDEASASYQRYLKSFDHDIPEFFQTTVGKNSSGSSGSSGGY